MIFQKHVLAKADTEEQACDMGMMILKHGAGMTCAYV